MKFVFFVFLAFLEQAACFPLNNCNKLKCEDLFLANISEHLPNATFE